MRAGRGGSESEALVWLRCSTAICAALAGACAGAAAGSLFEFKPSERQLRYDLVVSGDILVETPMGTQTIGTGSEGVVLLQIGERGSSGWAVTASFEALEVRPTGGLRAVRVTAEDILGKWYRGTLSRSGAIEVTDAPDIPSRIRDTVDPAALFADFLVPLPPSGDALSDPWPVSTTTTSNAAVRLTSVFEGTARFAGDTVWGGVRARVLLSEGPFELEGSGAPPGSPAEIDLVLAGESRRLYVWDFVRGVMLASRVANEAAGQVSVMGTDISMPASLSSEQEVRLRK